MRIFLAGATGAIGTPLLPLLLSHGHHVTATTTKPDKLERLRRLGAEPVWVDGLDGAAVSAAVQSARPDVIVHQMTALASLRSLKHFDDEFVMTNRLRIEGTRHLIDAARAASTPRLIAQSFTGWTNERQGGRVKTEEDSLDPNPPPSMKNTLDAIKTLEQIVTTASGVGGTALRYGMLYGPGTAISEHGEIVTAVRNRKFPIVGGGAGVWSFVHVEDAARATLAAVERDTSGIFNVVDDEPAEVTVWLPELAQAVGAAAPHHVPAWMGRFAVGDAGISMMTESRGSSNEKAKRALGWTLTYPSWRQGFRIGLA